MVLFILRQMHNKLSIMVPNCAKPLLTYHVAIFDYRGLGWQRSRSIDQGNEFPNFWHSNEILTHKSITHAGTVPITNHAMFTLSLVWLLAWVRSMWRYIAWIIQFVTKSNTTSHVCYRSVPTQLARDNRSIVRNSMLVAIWSMPIRNHRWGNVPYQTSNGNR